MRLPVLLVTALLTVAGTPAVAQEAGGDGTFQGFVTDVSRSAEVVTVEANPSDRAGAPRGVFAVDEGTEIFRQQGGQLEPASFEDLAIAQLVEVSYSGPVAESYPIQTVADEIVIVSGPLGGVPTHSQNQYEAPSGDAGNVSDSKPVALDTLPDTGGLPLMIPVAAALGISGGLLFRRAGR